MTLKEQLESLSACGDAIKWAGSRTLEQAWRECPRGDWMLWIYRRSSNYDFQKLTLAKGHCANTVRHLMTDERSKKAVDVAIAFGEGNASRADLNAAAAAAYAAAYASGQGALQQDAAYAAAYAADDAADAAAAYAYAAAYAADDARRKAKEENQKLTSDICRKYLPLPIL